LSEEKQAKNAATSQISLDGINQASRNRFHFSDSTCLSKVDAELSSSDCEFMSFERSNLSLKKPGLQKIPGWTAVMAMQAIATILFFNGQCHEIWCQGGE
jgi:hypothetical protein